MPDFGIGEALSAIFGGGDLLAGLFGGGAAAEAAAAPAEAAAIALPAIDVTAPAVIGAGELGAADAAAIGAGAAGAIPNILVPAAAAGSGLGIGDIVAGAGGLAAGLGSALMPSAAAAEAPAAATPGTSGSPFLNSEAQINAGGPIPTSELGLSPPVTSAAPTTATGATTASAPAGVTPTVGADPTAALSGAPTALDNLAAGTTPLGGVSGAGITPETGAIPAAANIGAPTGATAASTTPSPFSFLKSAGEGLFSSAGKSIAANPIGTALGAGGLIYSVMTADQISGAQKKLQEQAASLNAQGQGLMNYLTSGSLPPGLKASLDQATAAAKAKVISNYASQGLNTNPTQNSALAQQLAIIDQQAVVSIAQIGQQLFTSGLSETGLSSSLYTQLVNLDQTQTANIGKAIASFAAAVSPSKGLTLNVGAGKAA